VIMPKMAIRAHVLRLSSSLSLASYAAQLKLRTVVTSSQHILQLEPSATFVSVTRNPRGADGT